MKVLVFLTASILAAPILDAGTFSGKLATEHGVAIASGRLYAQLGTDAPVEFETDRSGNFSIDLGVGQWTIIADSDQIEDWGFSQLDGVTVSMDAEVPVSQNLILQASMPLRIPNLVFSRPDSRTVKLSVQGQGGTIVRIYSSADLVTWSPYYSKEMGATGFSYSSSSNANANYTQRFFKAVASVE